MSEEKIVDENEIIEETVTNEEDLETNVLEDDLEVEVVAENNDQDDSESLQAQIEQLKEELAEKDNKYLRLQADLENFRRRAKLDAEAAHKYRAQSLISEILPIIDNFERALQVKSDNEEVKSVLTGMEMVYNSLLEALKAEGAVQIEATGVEFDPNFHNAVMQVEDSNFESNIVVEELQKGYMLKDRVIRPSMVKVNK